jgi:hypothetical protein
VSDDNDKNVEAVDWAQKSAEAMNRHTASPEFTAKYKAWLERIGPELLSKTAKADYEQILTEEAPAKQAEVEKSIAAEDKTDLRLDATTANDCSGATVRKRLVL